MSLGAGALKAGGAGQQFFLWHREEVSIATLQAATTQTPPH